MLENSGASYSNSAIQPYDHGVAQLMDQAALEEGGFGSDRLAGDAQVVTWGPAVEVGALSHKLWEGRPQIYAATYCCERSARSPCPYPGLTQLMALSAAVDLLRVSTSLGL